MPLTKLNPVEINLAKIILTNRSYQGQYYSIQPTAPCYFGSIAKGSMENQSQSQLRPDGVKALNWKDRRDGGFPELPYFDITRSTRSGLAPRPPILNPGVDGLAAQFVFDAQQLIVFGHPVGAAQGTGLDLAGPGGYG